MAIQSDETLVTKGDLKTLYTDKILPYLGGNMMMQTGVSNYYSEDEKIIGLFTDGKPIYQKTIVGTTPNSIDTQGVIANLSSWNIDKVVDIKGCFSDNQAQMTINYYLHANNYAMVHLNGNHILTMQIGQSTHVNKPLFITIQYTKTTDTASSALTAPRCYDINRPDLWPNGQEIFFGNGLYGMRKAGTVAASSLSSGGIALVSNVSKTACCYNKGGMIDMSGTNGTNQYDINGGQDNGGSQKQFNPLITNTSQTFRFYCQNNQNYTTQNVQYNIWFIYTK